MSKYFKRFSDLISSHLKQEEANLILNRLRSFGYEKNSEKIKLSVRGIKWFVANKEKPVTRRVYEALLIRCLGEDYIDRIASDNPVGNEIIEYLRASRTPLEEAKHRYRLETSELCYRAEFHPKRSSSGNLKSKKNLSDTRKNIAKLSVGSVFRQPRKLKFITEEEHLGSGVEQSDEDTGLSSFAE